MSDLQDQDRARRSGEPAFNVPWPVGALIVVLILAHGARLVFWGDPDRFALMSTDLARGRLLGLVTHQFVHGSWTHLIMNAVFILAFGAPVARYLGGGPRGAVAFWMFFLACGAASAAIYAGLAERVGFAGVGGQPWALLGASGAASGLMGAAARLLDRGGQLGPIGGQRVWGMTVGWIIVNLVLGVSGLTPGAAGVPVAWQAHIAGFVCGLIVIGPFGWLAGVARDHVNAR